MSIDCHGPYSPEVMYETTSSINFNMDSKIQAMICEHFFESLLITSEFFNLHLLELMQWLDVPAVVHRLTTILVDYDHWIVLQDGKVSI